MAGGALVPGNADEREMIRLMETYSTPLLGICGVILGDWQPAQDAVQETFLRAWRAGELRRETEKAWLTRVAVNVCRDVRRGKWWRRVDRRVDPGDLALAAPEPRDEEIMAEVLRLPRSEREVVVMRYWQDLSADEIADALGVSRSAVYRRLERARKHLKLELEGGSNP